MRRDDPSASRTCSYTVSSGRQDDGSFRRVSSADHGSEETTTQSGDPQLNSLWHARSMTTEQLTQLSESLADSVSTAAPSVVQVHGAGRPASGLVFAPDIVITTMRALGREDGLHVRGHEGPAKEAQLAGWDPTTSLALLRVAGLAGAPIRPQLHNRASAISRSQSDDRGATLSAPARASLRSSAVRCAQAGVARSIRCFAPPRRCTTDSPAVRSSIRPAGCWA